MLALAIPLSLVIAIVAAVNFCLEGIKRDAMLASDYYPDILVQQQVGGRSESLFLDRYENVLRQMNGIKAFFPRVWGYINFSDQKARDKAFVVMGLEASYIDQGLALDITINQGRSLQQDDRNRGVIGQALAQALDCELGDTIEVTAPNRRQPVPLEVVGIFASPVQIYTADLLLTDSRTAREIFGFYAENEYSDILIYLDNPAMAPAMAQEISNRLEGARPLPKAAMQSLVAQSFGQRSGFFHLIWFILLLNIILIAWSLMSQISFSLRKEIGILKAIGWDTADIMAMKSMETLLVGLASVISGLLLGLAYMLLGAPGLKRFIIGWADIYPDYPIPLYVDGLTVLLIAMLGIFPLLAGTLIPVWRLGCIAPDEAIRT